MSRKYAVLKVAKVLDHGEADQGLRVGVKVTDENGTDCVILIPHEAVGAFYTTLEAAADYASKVRAKHGHSDDQMLYVTQIEGIDMGALDDGSIFLRFRKKGGINLDIPIPSQYIDTLIENLQRLKEAAADMPPPLKH